MFTGHKTPHEFIQSTFSPTIGLLCSPKVHNILIKNNLTFTELLHPFCANMGWEGQFREPGGGICIIKNMKLIVRDVNWKPLQPTEARKQLNNAVLNNYNENMIPFEIADLKIDIPKSTPWFDAWRETYFEVQFPSDHEYTKHFLSCILVATTSDDNVIESLEVLNQQFAELQNIPPPKLPKWFNNNVLKSYLLLHDVSSVSKDKAITIFESIKQKFGINMCFMLSINSKSTLDSNLLTDYWIPYVKRSLETNFDIPTSVLAPPLESKTATQVLPLDDSPPSQTVNQDEQHPLSPNEIDVYDSANSLQSHSFSGSTESVNVTGKTLDFSAEVHGAALNSNDIEAIKTFLQEYTTKALVPFLEKQISYLSELVANRKGVSRSLFSATKRWFGTGKGGNTTGNNAVIYSSDCPEIHLRRLADLWFLCGQWQRAFEVYHTAKREFYVDSAWLFYAGALEMAAVSAFMAGESNRKTHGYMEESIVTYLNTCRMIQYAVRATLLSVICLSSSNLHGDAAKQFIRMTSEDSDLRSAMLLEQAALCFLNGTISKAMHRKYAFHMVLAGHRFSKSGQKKHAYRCYKQAYQVFNESGWRLSTDHVQFALGRLAGALRQTHDAVQWLAKPLAPAASSHQAPIQQDAFLREYMLAHQQWVEATEAFKGCLPELPLPLLEKQATSILCIGPIPLSSPGRVPASSLTLKDNTSFAHDESKYWNKMEEMLLQAAKGAVPMIFKPTTDLYTEESDKNPTVPQGEPIQVSITLKNPLQIPILLKDVELLWQFTGKSQPEEPCEVLKNEPLIAAGSMLENNIICGQKLKSVLLEADGTETLIFSLTPLQVGDLVIKGVGYKLTYRSDTAGDKGLTILGKIPLSSDNDNLKRLHVTVIPYAPCLQMTFSETSNDAISCEIREVDVEFRNVGPVDIRNVYIAVSHPDCISFVTPDTGSNDFSILYEDKYSDPLNNSDERAQRVYAWREAVSRHVVCACDAVPRGGCTHAKLRIRPRAHISSLFMLAYYESDAHPSGYRLLRHVFSFKVSVAVDIAVMPRRSLRINETDIAENMNLVVEVKNVGNDKNNDVTLKVLEASLLSREWLLTDLISPAKNDLKIHLREKLHLLLKARRIMHAVPFGKIESSSLRINDNVETADNVNTHFYSEFVTDNVLSYVEKMELGTQGPRKTSTGLIQSMMLIKWTASDKINGKTYVGQHNLWLEDFTKTVSHEREHGSDSRTLLLEGSDSKPDIPEGKNKIKNDNTVLIKMEHSENIYHNFKERKLCLVPVVIHVVNCYSVPVRVFIDMTNQQSIESCGELGWTGALSHDSEEEDKKLGLKISLEKFESRSIQVKAVCATPGTYSVGSAFTISTAGVDHQDVVALVSNNTSLLVVQQTA